MDVFTRIEYFDIVMNALDCCIKNKSISIFRYCIIQIARICNQIARICNPCFFIIIT